MRRLSLPLAALALLGCSPAAATAAPGDLDPGFGAGGAVTTDFEPGAEDRGRDVAVDSSGRVVVAGSSDGRFAVARYTAAGALDPTFGGGDGLVTLHFGAGTEDIARGVAVDAAGRVVVAGSSDSDIAIARFTAGGALDPAFGGGDGKLTTDLGGDEYASDLAIDAAGRIVVGGTTGSDFVVLRYSASGMLDPSFDANGLATTDFGAADYPVGLALDGQGRIVVAGYSSGNLGDYAVARYLSSGILDSGFSGDGLTTTDVSGSGSLDFLEGVAVDGSDRVVAVGSSVAFGEPDGHIAALRYTAAGAPDPSFGGSGNGVMEAATNSMALGVAVDDRDRILLVGWAVSIDGYDDVLIRLLPEGSFDPDFGHGDGVATMPFTGDGVSVDSTGSIVAAGSHYVEATDTHDFAVARYQSDGPGPSPAAPSAATSAAAQAAVQAPEPRPRVSRACQRARQRVAARSRNLRRAGSRRQRRQARTRLRQARSAANRLCRR